MSLLEHSIREDLNFSAPRVMGVMDPVKITIINYPQDKTEQLEGEINPEQPELGKRSFPFSKHLFIEIFKYLLSKMPIWANPKMSK